MKSEQLVLVRSFLSLGYERASGDAPSTSTLIHLWTEFKEMRRRELEELEKAPSTTTFKPFSAKEKKWQLRNLERLHESKRTDTLRSLEETWSEGYRIPSAAECLYNIARRAFEYGWDSGLTYGGEECYILTEEDERRYRENIAWFKRNFPVVDSVQNIKDTQVLGQIAKEE